MRILAGEFFSRSLFKKKKKAYSHTDAFLILFSLSLKHDINSPDDVIWLIKKLDTFGH